jgi:hypothetical protein
MKVLAEVGAAQSHKLLFSHQDRKSYQSLQTVGMVADSVFELDDRHGAQTLVYLQHRTWSNGHQKVIPLMCPCRKFQTMMPMIRKAFVGCFEQ